MGRKERIDPIASAGLRQCLECEALQDDIAIWIADDALRNAIVPGVGIDQLVGRDAACQRLDLVLGVTLLFGKEAVVVGDDEAEVARAS